MKDIEESLNLLLEMKSSWEQSLTECKNLHEANADLHARVTKIEKENKTLNSHLRQLEDKLLEGNVIFQGIPDSVWESLETTKEKVLLAISHMIGGETQELKMDQARKIPIKDVTRLGKYTAMRNRSILVEFYYKSDALYLLSNRTNLPKGVFIYKQYSDETEKERRKLRPILRAARRSENYKGKCRMDGSVLVIKGRNYTSNNLHTLPLEINGFRATSKESEDGNVVGFFGELNPLSNFHPTPFTINGKSYHSSEQYIQQQKCVLFDDHNTERLIMSSESALDCKILSKDIKDYDHEKWKQNAKASCTAGVLAKFEQNPTLRKLLLSTGNKNLVECCHDKLWGTGVPLHNTDALVRSKWHSPGLLGEILESVRSILMEPAQDPMDTTIQISPT